MCLLIFFSTLHFQLFNFWIFNFSIFLNTSSTKKNLKRIFPNQLKIQNTWEQNICRWTGQYNAMFLATSSKNIRLLIMTKAARWFHKSIRFCYREIKMSLVWSTRVRCQHLQYHFIKRYIYEAQMCCTEPKIPLNCSRPPSVSRKKKQSNNYNSRLLNRRNLSASFGILGGVLGFRRRE